MKKRIGLLYSLSGTISIIGQGQLKVSLLAIEKINHSKTLQFEPVVADDKSDPKVAATQAYRLLKDERVDAIIGCYMSSVRNALLPVLNETGGILLYPTVYEGEQVHPNIFYLGAVPNQQIEPVLSYAFSSISTNFILVGSDYVYPRATNKQVKEFVENWGGRILSETYFPLGRDTFCDFFRKLRKLKRTFSSFCVFSTIVGTSVIEFYKEYHRNGIPFPIVSPITSEREIRLMGNGAASGHICSAPYFQTLDTVNNIDFIKSFKASYGDEPISREMASCYDAVHLLASGYEKIQRGAHGINETERLRTVLKASTLDGLQGRIVMDPNLQHLWQWSRIGRVDKHGQLVSLWQSAGAMPPRFSTVSSCAIGVLRRDKMSSRRTIPLIGKNKKFIDCVNLARVAAGNASNVLISGETGTGKDLFAQEIHANSNRWDKPYIPINCVTIPKELISSELFGYEEGTFTGARTGGRIGKLEAANGGTLFLDEIGEMSYEMQASLLRVIENKEIYRVGGTQAIQLDLRLIAATNRNLEKEIEHCCTFRKDLYYRLSVFHIQLPPLRHRLDDIPLLADHFLTQLCLQCGHRKVFLPETIDLMIGYPWPGNVRELKNAIERAFYLSLSSREIRPEYLPEWIAEKKCAGEELETVYPSVDEAGFDDDHHPQKLASVRKIPEKYAAVIQKRLELPCVSIKENEKTLIEAVLRDNQCNITKTSASLGIARNTLYRKIRKYNICLNSL